MEAYELLKHLGSVNHLLKRKKNYEFLFSYLLSGISDKIAVRKRVECKKDVFTLKIT